MGRSSTQNVRQTNVEQETSLLCFQILHSNRANFKALWWLWWCHIILGGRIILAMRRFSLLFWKSPESQGIMYTKTKEIRLTFICSNAVAKQSQGVNSLVMGCLNVRRGKGGRMSSSPDKPSISDPILGTSLNRSDTPEMPPGYLIVKNLQES